MAFTVCVSNRPTRVGAALVAAVASAISCAPNAAKIAPAPGVDADLDDGQAKDVAASDEGSLADSDAKLADESAAYDAPPPPKDSFKGPCPSDKLGWHPLDGLHGLVTQGFYAPGYGTAALIQTAPDQEICDLGFAATPCAYQLFGLNAEAEIQFSKPLPAPPVTVPRAMWPTPTGITIAEYHEHWQQAQTYLIQIVWSGSVAGGPPSNFQDLSGQVTAGMFLAKIDASVVAVADAVGASLDVAGNGAKAPSKLTFPQVVVQSLLAWGPDSILALGTTSDGTNQNWVARIGPDFKVKWQKHVAISTQPLLRGCSRKN